jgi:hypothetical protein
MTTRSPPPTTMRMRRRTLLPFPRSRGCGIQSPIHLSPSRLLHSCPSHVNTELGYFQCLLTEEMVAAIATPTIAYALSKGAPATWKTSAEEVWLFISVHIFMGRVNLPRCTCTVRASRDRHSSSTPSAVSASRSSSASSTSLHRRLLASAPLLSNRSARSSRRVSTPSPPATFPHSS